MGSNRSGAAHKLHGRRRDKDYERQYQRVEDAVLRNFLPLSEGVKIVSINDIKTRPSQPYVNPHTGEEKRVPGRHYAPKREGTRNTADLEESLVLNGLTEPLSVDSENFLVSGRRRLRALKRLGVRRVPVRSVADMTRAVQETLAAMAMRGE